MKMKFSSLTQVVDYYDKKSTNKMIRNLLFIVFSSCSVGAVIVVIVNIIDGSMNLILPAGIFAGTLSGMYLGMCIQKGKNK